MLMSFWKVLAFLDPSFITGFNDSQFDIPFLQGKVQLYSKKNTNVFELSIGNGLFGTTEIKINA